MTLTTPMSMAAAGTTGTGGGNGVAITGLGDLFAMLMGEVGTTGSAQAVGGGSDMGSLLSQLLGGTSLNSVQVQGNDILSKLLQGQGQGSTGTQVADNAGTDGGTNLVLEGDAGAVAVLVQQVEVMYQKVVVQGNFSLKTLNKPDELAQALTYLGMPADQATGVAARINTMLKILENQQKAVAGGSDSTGMLALMMAGTMMQGQMAGAAVQGNATGTETGQRQGFSLEIQVTQATATVKVIKLAQAFQQKSMTAADVARQMAGVQASTASQDAAAAAASSSPDAAAVQQDGKAGARQYINDLVGGQVKTDAKAASAQGQAASQVATDTGTDTQAATLVIQVNNDGKGGISIAVPQVASAGRDKTLKADDAVQTDATKSASAVAAMPAVLSKVEPGKVMDRPTGTVAYSLRAGKNGTETLHAVKAVVDAPAADWQAGNKDSAPQGLPAQTQNDGGFAAAMNAAAMNGAGGAQGAAHAANAFAAHMQMAQQAGIGQQVAVQMQPLFHNGGGAVRMTLHPADLGQVHIDLQVSDGKVHGTIAASNPAAVEQLARELHGLRQGLADAGLKLGEQGINLMLSNNQSQNQGQPQGGSGQGQRNNGRGMTAVEGVGSAEVATAATGAWVAPERVLDVNI